jgi:anti-sigma B factor antagonist
MSDVIVIPPVDIDPSTAPLLGAALLEPPDDAHIVVDFSDVEFCDSTGLRELLIAAQRQTNGGGSLRVAQPNESVRRIFEVTGLVTHLLAD